MIEKNKLDTIKKWKQKLLIAQTDVQEQLGDDAELYGDTKFSDFTLIACDGKEFQVHRSPLAMKSEFFNNIFRVGLGRGQKSLNISRIESATLEKAVMFIYTDKIEITDHEVAIDLLCAADHFQLHELKMICGAKLMDLIDENSALDILDAADEFKIDFLWEKCKKFIHQ